MGLGLGWVRDICLGFRVRVIGLVLLHHSR